jgi:UDP-4-amino-4,6-dideoxy-N-acetyl-beta-L-altrosamine transaminase
MAVLKTIKSNHSSTIDENRAVALEFLPYGRQHITEKDIKAVIGVLRSEWLTQGPAVPAFEAALAGRVGSKYAVACSNGTAALHLAMLALNISPGDEVVTSPITFLASANCAIYVGAHVRFADIDPDTGLIDPSSLKKLLEADKTGKIKAVIPVHFAGQPSDLGEIHSLAAAHGAEVIDDACHALGATYGIADQTFQIGGNNHSLMTVFSFHPVKHVAMGEGGAITTCDSEVVERLRKFRNHGIKKEDFAFPDLAYSTDGDVNPWYYEMADPGFNYRLTDIQAALGKSQLERLSDSIRRRNEIAAIYCALLDKNFPDGGVRHLHRKDGVSHAYHLFVVLIDFERFGISRAIVMNALRQAGIGTQVHYIPLHLQPFYRRACGTGPEDFPNAEAYYAKALSLPMYPELTKDDCRRVIETLSNILCGRM